MARKGHRPSKAPAGRPRFWGKHAVGAALSNPERTVRKILGTREALAGFDLPADVPVTYAEAADLARLVPGDAPHQGVVIEVEPLEDMWLADLLEHGKDDTRPLVILDGVTDPHNVGAILRSAAAFGAAAVVVQDRNAPPETGALARAASGALEKVPMLREVNLSRALDALKKAGLWVVGLAGDAPVTLAQAGLGGRRVALVLGAEGEGMRRLTREHCDELARLPIAPEMESLNVSAAAAVALYELARG